jgi:osmotically-inducible protein OsmY
MSENHGRARLLSTPQQAAGPSQERPLIQAEAQSRLRKSHYHELRFVSCEFHEGVVTLRGRVSSYHLKQLAQELIRRLDGAEEVNNRLEVAEQPCSP